MSRTVVVVSTRLGAVLPAAALPALRAAERVMADATVPEELVAAAGAERIAGRHAYDPLRREVLLTADPANRPREFAEQVIETPEPAGAALLDAVAVMDRLRAPGGCPWDAEQTHLSLLRYLVEECYELYQAVEDADRPALREELGDVLLQVLFHARLAKEGGVAPYPAGAASAAFGVDEVAADLVDKLVARHPHVFATEVPAADRVRTAADQERRWEELKRVEKRRESALDGVAFAQPAAALLFKLVTRARKAGVPMQLLAATVDHATGAGSRFAAAVARVAAAGDDPEQALRAAARRVDESVRAAEAAARSHGLDPHALTEPDWRRCWPSGASVAVSARVTAHSTE
ncbi:MAG TPA: MazG family protein [Pseudonocardia sp.]|jgi:XTP/dITP diphosphohydrolase|uniref:MazG family protein n=1 Tax=Pseudonocardia sp. TaxID=60912 RepID=UPI002F423672